MFAWKLASNALATWENKCKCNLKITNICPICGVEREDSFHALCRCPLATSLWRTMAEIWPLPELLSIHNTTSEWILHLLVGKTELERTRILMLLWRIWYVRNEVVHSKSAPPMEA